MRQPTDPSLLPLRGKISPAACLGRRVNRPFCTCCGGSEGIRAALRKPKNWKKRTLRSHRRSNFVEWCLTDQH